MSIVNKKIDLFGNGIPGAATYQKTEYKGTNAKQLACLVLSSGSSTTSCDDVFDVTAPVQAITIRQTADFSMTKSLDSDFIVSAFGDTPVEIHVTGLHVLRMPDGGEKPITEWYDKNRISKSRKNRVKVSIRLSGDVAVYNCIVCGLTMDGYKESIDSGLITYKLDLIGVRKK